MTEDLLHFIWKFKLLKPGDYYSVSGKHIEIMRTGEHSMHAGPDFINARIKIDHTEWAGNVEIHKKTSDWDSHRHSSDEAYKNVVLHVVYEHDREISPAHETFEIKHLLDTAVLEKYERLYKEKREIACGKAFSDLHELSRESWLQRVLIERLESRMAFIEELFVFTQSNWDETFYLLLCKNFGFHVNGEAFLQLAKSIPLRILLKHRENTLQTEALLLGQAGLLKEEPEDTYGQLLYKEYSYLAHKYKLSAIPHKMKFLRLRPANFPTIRIAQLAAFLKHYQKTFSKITEARSIEEVKTLFTGEISAYWQTHYLPGKESASKKKELGESSVENILINTVCPLLFFYGKEKKEEQYCEKALQWLEEVGAEDNHLIAHYKELDFKPKHAAHTQALLQLHAHYCKPKRCLQCGIGTGILKHGG